jgi:chemotaxis response regulator CheB
MSIAPSRAQVGAGGKRKRSESKRSSSVAAMSKAIINENNAAGQQPVDEMEAQLCPTVEDAVKLAAVIRM